MSLQGQEPKTTSKPPQQKPVVRAQVKSELVSQLKKNGASTTKLKQLPKPSQQAVVEAVVEAAVDRTPDAANVQPVPVDGGPTAATPEAIAAAAAALLQDEIFEVKKAQLTQGFKDHHSVGVDDIPAIQKKLDELRAPAIQAAAEAFLKDGFIEIKSRQLSAKVQTTYKVGPKDLPAIQTKLNELREANPVKKVTGQYDVTKPENRPGEGGMSDGDASQIAQLNGWNEVSNPKRFTCKDPAHSPKGKLFMNAEGVYYGADNTGHVGWGFKMWTGKGTTLEYKGNLVWDVPSQQWKPIGRSGATI
jgi:hypothetical protein